MATLVTSQLQDSISDKAKILSPQNSGKAISLQNSGKAISLRNNALDNEAICSCSCTRTSIIVFLFNTTVFYPTLIKMDPPEALGENVYQGYINGIHVKWSTLGKHRLLSENGSPSEVSEVKRMAVYESCLRLGDKKLDILYGNNDQTS